MTIVDLSVTVVTGLLAWLGLVYLTARAAAAGWRHGPVADETPRDERQELRA